MIVLFHPGAVRGEFNPSLPKNRNAMALQLATFLNMTPWEISSATPAGTFAAWPRPVSRSAIPPLQRGNDKMRKLLLMLTIAAISLFANMQPS
jgi:hypothetical protein